MYGLCSGGKQQAFVLLWVWAPKLLTALLPHCRKGQEESKAKAPLHTMGEQNPCPQVLSVWGRQSSTKGTESSP